MNLRQLQQFVTLAETGNFHRAAERLHMAQPPLSVSIRKLEEELGAPLFERTPAGVRLTAAGGGMLAHAQRALFHAQQCQASVRAGVRGEAGLLKLGFVGSATYALLPRLIASFRKRYPAIDLELTEHTTAGALDGLVERRLDAAIVRYPLVDPRPFRLTPLEADEFVLAVSARSPFAGRRSIPLSEVAGEPFIMYGAQRVPGLFAIATLRCQQSGFTPRIAQEAAQVQTILSLVQSGLGVALVAGVARKYVPSGVRLLALSDTPAGFELGLALVTPEENASRVAQTFEQHALGG
ncbi:LysR family transcriptional regulator [Ramlibacter sp. MAHUQ-53]|uniref:LysR family transcriptional regulator n=1 Tax=unclassified Ramlibacter TaxID=2617605 RepID=UPI0036376F17